MAPKELAAYSGRPKKQCHMLYNVSTLGWGVATFASGQHPAAKAQL